MVAMNESSACHGKRDSRQCVNTAAHGNILVQVKVDGQDTEEEDLRFEILPGRIRCAVPAVA